MIELDSKKSCVFFCPTHPTSLHKLLQIAASIKINLPIVFVVINEYVAKNTYLIEKAGFDFVCIEAFDVSKEKRITHDVVNRTKTTLFFNNIVTRAKNILKQIGVIQTLTRSRRARFTNNLQVNLVKDYQQKVQNTQRLFNDYSPTVLVASSDRILGYLCCLLNEAKSRNVKIILPPIAIISGSKEVVENRLKKQDANLLANDTGLDEEFPEQFFSASNGKLVSFYSVWMLKPLSDLGVLPQSPWRYGESFADVLLLDGELQKERCLNEGVDAEKMLIVGDTEFDELYDIWLEQKSDEKFIDPKKAVIALPQLFEHGLLGFEEQTELVNDICNGAASNNIECLISLHPKMSLARYKYLENIPGMKISQEPLRVILPQADIFIATNGSSTWLWAALCGIPTVLCDWSGLDYDFINHENLGLEIIRCKHDYFQYLAELSRDNEFYNQQKEMQLTAANLLAKFDGKASLRISEVINSYIS